MEVARLLYHPTRLAGSFFIPPARVYVDYAVRATCIWLSPLPRSACGRRLNFCFPAHDPSDLLTVPAKAACRCFPGGEIVCIESIAAWRGAPV